MSPCYNTVARISITARSFTGDGVIIGGTDATFAPTIVVVNE